MVLSNISIMWLSSVPVGKETAYSFTPAIAVINSGSGMYASDLPQNSIAESRTALSITKSGAACAALHEVASAAVGSVVCTNEAFNAMASSQSIVKLVGEKNKSS